MLSYGFCKQCTINLNLNLNLIYFKLWFILQKVDNNPVLSESVWALISTVTASQSSPKLYGHWSYILDKVAALTRRTNKLKLEGS